MRTATRRAVAGLVAAFGAAALALTGGALASAAGPAPAAQEPAAAAAVAGGPWLTGYWQNFDNGATVLRLSQVPAAYNLVAVAFAENQAGTPGGITFEVASAELGGYTEAQFKADVAAMHAQGRKVVLSVGGEKGNVVISNATEAKSFADSAYALMQEYGFDGVDIDLEHGIDATAMADALHQLSARAGPDLILTMAPQTIDYQATSMGYYQLTLAIKDILTIVNTQYYNSGSMLGCDQKVYSQGTVDFLTALSCIQLEMGLRPDQVGIGVPATSRAAGGGYQPASNVVQALDCLEARTGCGAFTPAKAYGPIGGAMTWSINWDATNGYAFADVVGGRLATGPSTPPTDRPVDPTDPPVDPGDCTAAAWAASSVYTGGNRVSYQGHTYEAKWWTTNENPAQSGQWGVWRDLGAC
ncbi:MULTISPECIES: glycosyl hydrolase family 18 protein [unclassified Isoptericola]|uniref:glycosyl hydrolase family 18 protein n=1 Tax=Isoptericola sp. NPDC060185 TaxID=3347065 RepID=UPI0036599EF2